MTKEEFRRLAQSGLLFLDGATGSNLQKQGMPVGVCPELWITEHEEIMIGLQKAYLEAGTNILYAPTFTANRIKLKEFDLEDRIEELNHKLVEISKRAADGKALVAGDLTMTGQQLKPMGPLDFEELIDVYKEQIRYITEAGADLLVVETMMSLQESRAALIAAKETCPDIPVMVTMTFESDGRSLFGTDAATAAIVLSSLGADAVGANCSTGPDQMAEVIRRMAKVTDIPIIAKPNAGLPSLDEKGQTVYDMGPEEFGADMELLLDAGAQILGGCCGTTPEHIRKMTHRLAGRPVPVHGNQTQRALTSERASLTFDLDGPFLIVGERINPTGKKKLQQELREGSFELVTQFAQEQEERGASILDVNMGMSGIDEKAMMLQALEEVAGVTKLPLSIDSSHVDIIEAALRIYPGRALINSISLEEKKCRPLMRIAKKYGAMAILLPLSDKGLPENLDEKKEIIRRLLEIADEEGLSRDSLIIDGLVATVGANRMAALETLDTIAYCKNELQIPTICGLSNISFGLPERSFVNTAFLTMAICRGLTMAIANPSQELLMNAAFASDMLLHRPDSDIRYIERMNKLAEEKAKYETVVVKKEGAAGGTASVEEKADPVTTAVLKGNKGSIIDEVKKSPNFDILISREDACLIEDHHEAFVNHIVNVMQNTTKIVDDLSKIEGPFLKIAICNMIHDTKVIMQYLEHLQEMFGAEIKVVTSGNIWIDFIAPGTNKGAALSNLMKLFHVKPEECMAFGDQQNDLEMLELVGHSYAMSNSAPGVSYYADEVTDSVEDVLEDVLASLDK